MLCPFCGHEESKVTDSRTVTETHAVRRRRECLKCLKRFTTFETIDLTLQVLKRNGVYQDFSQEKLIKGLSAACNHTTVSHAKVLALVSKVSAQLMAKQGKEVTTEEIGEMVMEHLQKLDPIAYIRFASVYRRFTRVDELMNALESIPSV